MQGSDENRTWTRAVLYKYISLKKYTSLFFLTKRSIPLYLGTPLYIYFFPPFLENSSRKSTFHISCILTDLPLNYQNTQHQVQELPTVTVKIKQIITTMNRTAVNFGNWSVKSK